MTDRKTDVNTAALGTPEFQTYIGDPFQSEGPEIPALVHKHLTTAALARNHGAARKCTDLGNAERFADDFAGKLLYNATEKAWYYWDGTRWQRDERQYVNHCARLTVRSIYGEAGVCEDVGRRRELAGWAAKSESTMHIRGMLELAKSDPQFSALSSDFDACPWLFNTPSGTVDLRTGTLREHDPADRITKISPVSYDPAAADPAEFQFFLYEISDEREEIIEYLRRYLGYCLTGFTSEQSFLVFHGSGANGKSTLLRILFHVFGDYALATPPDTLMVKRQAGTATNDLARLLGARLVSAQETEEGQRLSESRIKAMTGGDTIVARKLYGEFFEFPATFKIILSTNHRPRVRGQDYAIWRRVKLVPFDVTIPPERRDPVKAERIIEREAAGILRWLVGGCLDWQRDGLGECETVTAATEEYRSAEDFLGPFIADRCITGEGFRSQGATLYAAYRQWCEENGERPLSNKAYARALEDRGFKYFRTNTGRFWAGIGLQDEK